MIKCTESDCAREFLSEDRRAEHVHAVHGDEARNVSTKERKKLAKSGSAMSDGSYPIANKQDLKNAIQAFGRASNKAAVKAHIIKRAKALGATNLLPQGWTSDGAALVECPDEYCGRVFRHEALFVDHAEAVHTFDDVRMIVSQGLREKYAKDGNDWKSTIYIYVADLAEDWVVFEASQGGESDLYKCSYSIVDGTATFGVLTEVMRRTVYDPVGANEPDGVLGDPKNLNGSDS